MRLECDSERFSEVSRGSAAACDARGQTLCVHLHAIGSDSRWKSFQSNTLS